MLVLKRQLGQRIRIGGGIVITITEITSSSVKVGIDAPSDVSIFREELCNGTGEPRRDAVSSDGGRR
jgi:carbon storage regulator